MYKKNDNDIYGQNRESRKLHLERSVTIPKTSTYRDLTSGSLIKNLWSLAVPMIIGNILQNAFTIVDMIFVGRLGPIAVASVSISGLIMMVAWTLLIGVSIGTVAMVSRYFGAHDLEKAQSAAVQSLILGCVISVILLIFGLALDKPVLKILGATSEMMAPATAYFRIVFGGAFTLIFMFLASYILRGSGDAKTAMYMMIVATVFNIILDPLLIF